jgi:hypothetical protein
VRDSKVKGLTMSEWYALYYQLAADREDTVKDLIQHSRPPRPDVTAEDGTRVGRLLSMLAFVGVEKVIRVFEVDGPASTVAAALTRQEEERAFERDLEPCVSAPRDMTTPEGLAEAMIPCSLSLGTVPDEDWPGTNWQALFYPLKPGTEEQVAGLFAGSGSPNLDVLDEDGNKVGRLMRTMAFVGNAKALRVNQIEGTIEAVAAHMSRQGTANAFQRQLDQYLAVPRDMGDLPAARSFFITAIMQSVQVRRYGQEP